MSKTASKPIAVTGIGMVTSLGQGKAENWRRLSAGESGIHRLTRFPVNGLRTTIGGSVDYLDLDPFDAPALSHEMARLAAQEALSESAIGQPGAFPGQLFLAGPPLDVDWQMRFELARQQSAIRYSG